MKNTIVGLIYDDSGATAIEYAILAALVSISCIGALWNLGSSLWQLFSPVEQTLHKCVQVGSNCGK